MTRTRLLTLTSIIAIGLLLTLKVASISFAQDADNNDDILGSGVVNYSFDENSTTGSRTGTITVGGKNFTLIQAKAISQTGITPSSMSHCDVGMQTFMTNYQIPGATYAIAKNGKLVYMRAFGTANQAGTETTQPHHLFRIASLSKPITSIAIMKLIESGQLKLSDKVFGTNGILNSDPYFANAGVTDTRVFNITVQNLLEHSAGWNRDLFMLPNPLPPYSRGFKSDPIAFPLHVTQTLGEANPVTRRAMIKFLMKKGLDFAPGTAYNYSNIGYLILGEVIEKKTGMNYENYVKQNILNPIGAYDIHLGKNLLADKREREGEYIAPSANTTLSAYGTGQYVPWQYGGWSLEAMDAHGGWIATARDLARLVTAVDGFPSRTDILSSTTIQTMTAPSANNAYYAKGWAVNPANNWWHTGSLDGTASIMVRTSGQYVWAIILNKSADGNFFNDLDTLPWNCVNNTSSFPTYDLFDVPTQNASAMTFSNVFSNSMDVSWTNGNGNGRVLVMRAGSAPNKFPLDGTDYTGGDLGDGNYVIYNGTGNIKTVNNLAANTSYHFRLYEYKKNANTGNYALYQLGNPASGSQKTLPMGLLNIDDVSVLEPISGTATANFTVSLSQASSQTTTVNFATANGTAAAPADFTAIPTTTLTFSAGQTLKTVQVTVNADTITEALETFFVNLSNATNATIADNQGVGTIRQQYGNSGDIVFSSRRDGNYEIYTMNSSNGGGLPRLTINAASDTGPSFSPDGSKIVFESNRDGYFEIYTMNIDGTGLIRLTNNAADDVDASFSPDGSKIVFTSFRDGKTEIYTMNSSDGSGQTRLTNNNAYDSYPSFSPDGNKIAFSSNRDGNYEIYTMNSDGNGQTPLTNNAAEDNVPSYSPDGSRIIFTSNRDGNSEIYTMNSTDGNEMTRLTFNTATDLYSSFSPDGTKILFQSNRDDYNYEIYTMNIDGSGLVRLTNNTAFDQYPKWQPVANTTSSTPTSAGTNVTVTPTNNLNMAFGNVTTAGTTTVNALSQSQLPPLPANFSLTSSPIMYDITTSAVYSGNITISFNVPNVADAQACSRLRILHYINNAWDDSNNFAPLYNSGTKVCTVSQTVTSLSPFVVAQYNGTTSCTYSINPTSVNVSHISSSGSVALSTQSGCAWTATNNNPTWITITGNASGNGNGNVNFLIRNNGGIARTGILTIGGQTFTINQTSFVNFDFDGDGKADISVFRPDGGVWYLLQSNNGFTGAQFGVSTDKIVPADYDGDGKTDLAVYRGGTWYLNRSSAGFTGYPFGAPDDIPQPADFDGDGKAELAVYRPSNGTWYVFNLATNQFTAAQFGASTDKPVVGDYNGDSKADYAVYRPSNGTWYIAKPTGTPAQDFDSIKFGDSADKPVAADYDGDGKTDVAVFRPSNGSWYLLRSTAGFTGVQFGISTDLPTPADYDGDGKADISVFRSGNWYRLNSSSGVFYAEQFGVATDRPIQNAFVQ